MGLIVTLCIEIVDEEFVDNISCCDKFVYDNKSTRVHLNFMWMRRSPTVQIQTKINSPDNFIT
jgi:hypothetical protein